MYARNWMCGWCIASLWMKCKPESVDGVAALWMGDVIPFNHACCSEISTHVQMIKYLLSDHLLLLLDDVDFGPCLSAVIARVLVVHKSIHFQFNLGLCWLKQLTLMWEVVWHSEKRNMTLSWSWVFIWDRCLLLFPESKAQV